MLIQLDVARSLGVGLLVIACVGITVRVVAEGLTNWSRRMQVVQAFSNLQRWSAQNNYTILFREQARESPFVKNGGGPLAFRVVVQDQHGERRWGWVLCGSRLEVKWGEPESVFDSSRTKHDPLWDYDVDV